MNIYKARDLYIKYNRSMWAAFGYSPKSNGQEIESFNLQWVGLTIYERRMTVSYWQRYLKEFSACFKNNS